MEPIRTNLEAFKKKMFDTLPYLCLGIILFATIILFFGSANAVIGIIFLFFAKGAVHSAFTIESHLTSGFLFLLMAVLGTFATMGYLTSIVLNFLVFFLLIFVYSDDFAPKNYFLFGLEFVLMQMNPGTFDMLLNRSFAVLYGFAVTTLFIIVAKRLKKEPAENPLIKKGFAVISNQLNSLSKGELSQLHAGEIFDIASKYCAVEYNTVFKQNGLMSGKEKNRFQLVLCLEQLGQLINEAKLHYEELDQADRSYFYDLSKLFENSMTRDKLISQLEHFLKNSHLQDSHLNSDWRLLLQSLIKTLHAKTEKVNHTATVKNKLAYKGSQLKQHWGFHYFQFRFAIQKSLILAFSFALANALPFTNSYWIPIMVYTTIGAYHDEAFKSAVTRVGGTLAGLACFVLVTQFIPVNVRLFVVLFIGLTIILSTTNVFITMIAGTQMAVSSIAPVFDTIPSILLRFSCVIVGAVIAVVGGRLILRANRDDNYQAKLNELLQIDNQLVTELNHALEQGMRGNHVSELILSLHLTTNELLKAMPRRKMIDKVQLAKLIIYNRSFLKEVLLIFMSLDLSKTDKENSETIQEALIVLEHLLATKTEVQKESEIYSAYIEKAKSKTNLDYRIAKCSLAFQQIRGKVHLSGD